MHRMKSCSSFAAPICLALAMLIVAPAHAENSVDSTEQDKSLHLYSVRIIKDRLWQHGTLNGIYLGGGAVLTAAHVVGRWHLLKALHVQIAGEVLPATIVKEGWADEIDLTVLSVDEAQLPVSLRLRRNPVCKGPLQVGQEVVVVAGWGTARSRVLSPLVVPARTRKTFDTIISDVPMALSGTGVFDAKSRCLLGIITRKISRVDARRIDPRGVSKIAESAKYFVPAPTIAEFLPKQFRF
jgi:hypothetical protein